MRAKRSLAQRSRKGSGNRANYDEENAGSLGVSRKADYTRSLGVYPVTSEIWSFALTFTLPVQSSLSCGLLESTWVSTIGAAKNLRTLPS
ncbi:hypothetical protein TSAR_005216 [Trichomalopsis sarcophagae]|uniref:Uncharacterized protein n=1 Tax=Trichomalopsis sarcophagae TaxID=543379 RepID=A0A232F0W5_9HYME|nr:hypothetical protein TSAR_005216 [Trichomalopsis sarcophagae]